MIFETLTFDGRGTSLDDKRKRRHSAWRSTASCWSTRSGTPPRCLGEMFLGGRALPHRSFFQAGKNLSSTAVFNEADRALEAKTDPAKRKEQFNTMLDAWEDEAPGNVPYQPAEFCAVRKHVKWRPHYSESARPDRR